MNTITNNPGTLHNCCSIDAFSCTFTNASHEEVIKNILHLDHLDWQHQDFGRHRYQKKVVFGNITILYDGTKNMGVCLELTGQGCTELVHLTGNYSIFHDILCFSSATLTRIDIAIDDHKGLVDMSNVVTKIDRGEIRTRMRATTECKGLANTTGHTVYIGSASSNCRIRIYDKQAQMQTTYPWVRTEMVLRHEDARRFQALAVESINSCSANRNEEIAVLGTAVLYDKFCFIDATDINISRCNVSPWWAELMDAKPIHLASVSKSIPTIEKAAEWIKKQVAPTLILLLCILGPEWLDTLIEEGCVHIDRARAIMWLQQMHAIGMSVTVDPHGDDLAHTIREEILNYYNN